MRGEGEVTQFWDLEAPDVQTSKDVVKVLVRGRNFRKVSTEVGRHFLTKFTYYFSTLGNTINRAYPRIRSSF